MKSIMYGLILIRWSKVFQPVILRSDNLLLPTTFNWNILFKMEWRRGGEEERSGNTELEFYVGNATLQLQLTINTKNKYQTSISG